MSPWTSVRRYLGIFGRRCDPRTGIHPRAYARIFARSHGVSGIFTNYTIPLCHGAYSRRCCEGCIPRRSSAYLLACDDLQRHGLQQVKQFTGAVMSFRAAALRALRFDPNLTGGSLAEDIDLCARLPRSAVLVIAPKARLFHKRSVVGRPTGHWLEEHAQSSAYMRTRNWHRGLGDALCFGWLQIGYVLMATIGSLKRGSWEPFRAWRRAGRGTKCRLATAKLSSCGYAKETAA